MIRSLIDRLRSSFAHLLSTGILWAVVVAASIGFSGWLIASIDRWSAPPETFSTDDLGAEYDSITQAILKGRGFADPFRRQSGPTAWMPPAVPYILAGIYRIAHGDREAVIEIVRVLQAMSTAFGLFPALLVIRRMRFRYAYVGILLVGVAIHFETLFSLSHDHILLIPIAAATWMFMLVDDRHAGFRYATAMGIFGGIAALANPTSGAVWGLVCAGRFRRNLGIVVVAGVASILTVAPWMARNYRTFGVWIPIKSNADFEIWQAIVQDDDGVLDKETLRAHPYPRPNAVEGSRYHELGEIRYLQEKKRLWRESDEARIGPWLARTSNRLVAALLWYSPVSKSEYANPSLLFLMRAWKILATFSLVVIFYDRRTSIQPFLAVAIAIWLLQLTPYIAISYYERYSWPTFPMQSIVVVEGLRRVGQFLVNRPNAGPTG